jgi:HD-like signal output (HDOD) protein/DNA-binding CsgD family transcriptional regulator
MSDTSTRTAGRERRAGAGGRRLAAAFDAVSELPALAEARRRLIKTCERQAAAPGDIADVVESDAALAIAVMRAANNGNGPSGRTSGVREAIEALRPDGVQALAAGLETYDVLEHPGPLSDRHERFRRHGVAVRNAAERIGELTRLPQRDELAIAALLHDVGKLVLIELYGDRPPASGPGEKPEDRVRRERRELGIDHALVGAVLIRRWGLGGAAATAVERHHSRDAEGHAAAIRLGDLIVHQAAGDPVALDSLRGAAAALEIDDAGLSSLMFEFPHVGERRRRASEPCPLSMREIDALQGLAEGKVYKQIAHELSLSVSTVRTHLHNVYRKIGAVDRAQAVLIARDRGWL